jgi:hypothetical protein
MIVTESINRTSAMGTTIAATLTPPSEPWESTDGVIASVAVGCIGRLGVGFVSPLGVGLIGSLDGGLWEIVAVGPGDLVGDSENVTGE